ncbi:signal peptidase I [Lipingzhangella sp. LS1_29]|uniref:Signal peptidase I n=1 Tax=Lipingzhangella rawalii TaxID=2055835 RepID=A0ABU2H5N7_9ACTN|nr:signal peptidase I [Lipingzhangella rawalii]MDS1270626.1 signal peptidase I [Lipingzhangella rawalii]
MSNEEQDSRAAADTEADETHGNESFGSSAQARGGAACASEEEDTGAASAGEAPGSAMGASGNKKRAEKSGSFWKELPVLVAIALVLAFVIKTWVVQPFYIPSQSMEDTLQVDDRVLVNKLVYQVRDIDRGELVVFNGSDSWDEDTVVEQPEASNPVQGFFGWLSQSLGLAPSGKDYIKRVIGLPGDTVECCDEQGRLVINDEPLDEPYLYPDSLETHQEFGPVTIDEGRLWVMGDHRAVSYDSRTHQSDPGGGTISEESVVGRAFVTVWPLDRITTHPIPDSIE